MERAAVIVGVSRAGSLPQLQAVDAGVTRMEKWALEQGIPETRIELLSDADGGEVLAHDLYTAVESQVARATVEQLIVYFAGHGVNNGYSEYWLLSNAPGNPNEAINVAGSMVLAERSGIPHVVLVSDACRTRPDSISAQSVTGSLMFPNQPPAGPSVSVDVFYACLLGDPAHEFKDPLDASAVFQSLYTEVLLEALRCRHSDVVETVTEGESRFDLIRPWPLKRHLPSLVSARIRDQQLWRTLSQTPDARVTSDPTTAWIARQVVAERGRIRRRRRSAPQDLRTAVATEINRSVDPDRHPPEAADPSSFSGGRDGVGLSAAGTAESREEFVRTAGALAGEFGPLHYESNAGFKVRGGRVVDAKGIGVGAEHLSEDLVRIWGVDEQNRGANLLMRFSSGACAVLPAIYRFIGAVTLEGGHLVDVSYEPMDTNPRWQEFHERAAEIRRARSMLAAATRLGMLSLETESALALARHLQGLKGLDPSAALYAAYAYYDLGRRDLIEEMRDYQVGELGVTFFDLDLLLGRAPRSHRLDGPPEAVPFVPMLSRGWSLMAAHEVEPPAAVADPGRRLPSLWTLFTPETYDRIRSAIAAGEV